MKSIFGWLKNRRKIITRDDETLYLVRYRIIDLPWFKIRVHHILNSDDACLHDHPWNFISIILKGGYWEQEDSSKCRFFGPKWYKPGSVLYRRAEWKHSLEIPAGRTCWTLVIMFRRRRDWGFWTKFGWINWKQYSHKEHCD